MTLIFSSKQLNACGVDTRIFWEYTKDADALAPCVARSSATMILTVYDKGVPSLTKGFNDLTFLVLRNNTKYNYIFQYFLKWIQHEKGQGIWLWNVKQKDSNMPKEFVRNKVFKASLCCGFLNPLHAKFFRGNKNILTFYIIAPHWKDTVSWNPSSCKTRTFLFYIVNIMAANYLAMQGDRASASMIFNMLNWINSVPACYGLIIKCHTAFSYF